jgi:hypothetical protein
METIPRVNLAHVVFVSGPVARNPVCLFLTVLAVLVTIFLKK